MRGKFGMIAMAGLLLAGVTGYAQKGDNLGQGQAVVTVLPAHSSGAPVNVSAQQLKVKVDGKDASVTGLTPLRGADGRIELIVLIDGSARSSLGNQFSSITDFVKEMPANTKVAIGYMEEGRAVTGPLSTDPTQILSGLHLPGGPAGTSGSPYFCLSDLAKHWPSQDRGARREVVMITDGVDDYSPHYDPQDPYVQAAITDSVRSGLVVYAMYWRSEGRMDRTGWAQNAGQNLLMQLTQATGGNSYWEGFGNPVSFDPYFQDLRIRLRSQYTVSFTSQVGGKAGIERLQVKAQIPGAKIDAPQQVWVSHGEMAQR